MNGYSATLLKGQEGEDGGKDLERREKYVEEKREGGMGLGKLQKRRSLVKTLIKVVGIKASGIVL